MIIANANTPGVSGYLSGARQQNKNKVITHWVNLEVAGSNPAYPEVNFILKFIQGGKEIKIALGAA